MQVFIVDDSALVRQRLAELLVAVEHVHVIGEAGTVADALSRIPELRPDLVTVDIRMPDGDGVSVLKAIKQLDRPPLVGVLTMFPTEPSRRRCYALGADFFWDKSKDLTAMTDVMRRLTQAEHTES
ncbi:MAG TPA: response regulator transcription factor [Gemmatimonadales bacterium]|jgi:two-component system, NarL family, response regulator DevR|nr:response regulator transcription factor [Gemmatimonadales bacterium]